MNLNLVGDILQEQSFGAGGMFSKVFVQKHPNASVLKPISSIALKTVLEIARIYFETKMMNLD